MSFFIVNYFSGNYFQGILFRGEFVALSKMYISFIFTLKHYVIFRLAKIGSN